MPMSMPMRQAISGGGLRRVATETAVWVMQCRQVSGPVWHHHTGPSAVRVVECAHAPARMAIVGRDREQAELATALTSTRAGYGRAVLLLGEAGMGKSMLADWLVSQAVHP
jgi:hypothetical protein